MSSDTPAASKKSIDDSTVASGVGHVTADAVDTKGEILHTHPDGESGTSSYGEEDHGDDDIATAEHDLAHYNPRGPPTRPVYSGPKPTKPKPRPIR